MRVLGVELEGRETWRLAGKRPGGILVKNISLSIPCAKRHLEAPYLPIG